MADPFTLAAISIGTTAVGGGISALGNIATGEANANAYTYKAGVAAVNKQIADNNAAYAVAAGETAAQQSGMSTRFALGQTKVAQGASGLNVNRGSAVDVRAGTAEIGEENEMQIRANAAKEAYGYKIAGLQATEEGTLATMAARTSRTAGAISAGSSILGAGGSVANKWLQFGQQGIEGFGTPNLVS